MKPAILVSTFLLTVACLGAAAADKLNVLLVTGGHGFDHEPFLKVFRDNPAINVTEVAHQKNADAFDRADLPQYQVVVLYDMPKSITPAQQEKLQSLFRRGTGLVVLHHALCSYPQWPDYERIIGGRYPEADPAVGYQHDVQVPVVVQAKDHPITAGVADFTIHDEIYWGFRVGKDVTPLLTTPHAKSGKTLAWTRTEGQSRVVYLQLGHGPEAYAHPAFRKLVAQSIAWAAK